MRKSNINKKEDINDPSLLIAKTGIILDTFDSCEKEEGRQVHLKHLVHFATREINLMLPCAVTSKKEVTSILNELNRIGIIHYPKKGLIERGRDYSKI